MKVPVANLGLPSRVDDVHLAGDSVRWAQTCFADNAEKGIAEILHEAFGILEAVFRKGVPDSGVGACGREVITFGPVLGSLFFNDGFVCSVGGINGGVIREEVLQNEYTGAVNKDVVEFIFEEVFRELLANFVTIIDWYVLLDIAGSRICLFQCLLLDNGLESRE